MHPILHGVWAVGHPRLTTEGRWMAAVLAVSHDVDPAGVPLVAALSHASAAALLRIHSKGEERIHVTVKTAGGRGHPALTVHRRPGVRAEDLGRSRGIPVTSPELTLIDLATLVSGRELERAVDEAHRRGLIDERALRRALVRNRGRRGVARLGRVVREHEIGSTVTRSRLEELMLELCRRHDLPTPGVNVELHGFTVDMLWPAERLVVELDGRATHATPAAFQRDRDRDGALSALGYATLRFTWWDLTRRPAVVAHRLRRTLHRLAE